MKNLLCILAVSCCLQTSAFAQAGWVRLSSKLDDLDIKSVAADVNNPQLIFAGSEKRVYRSQDGGRSWKQVFAAKGDNSVRFIYLSPFKSGEIYLATDRGVERSLDGGDDWDLFFSGIGDKGKLAFCVAAGPLNPRAIWIGTVDGLYVTDPKGGAVKLAGIPDAPIHAVLLGGSHENSVCLVAADKGIYKSKDLGKNWDRVVFNQESAAVTEVQTTLEQFDVEEMAAAPFASSLVFIEGSGQIYAATREGLMEGMAETISWNRMDGQNLPSRKINTLVKSARNMYVAMDYGVFQWDFKARSFRDISQGLDSLRVNTLCYNPYGNYLLAGTSKGLFKLSYPELDLSFLHARGVESNRPSIDIKAVMGHFRNEPPIEEIQAAAIRYAEVHPSKIEVWRKAAALKAFLPSLSLDYDLSSDENIDLDRGGTADPDQFIAGPEERSRDWSVGLSWDLSELIWNNDQTSIDTRSRLMVELRDDVLNQVTHLYFERRRLQVEMALSDAQDLPVKIEKELRLQELTANIDALTGGYLSRKIKAVPHS